jgi:ABC-type multidrug transport system fused ATPase/permease subunit
MDHLSLPTNQLRSMAWAIYGLDGRPADYLVSSTLDSTMRKSNLKVKCGDRNAIFAARRGIPCCRINVLPARSFPILTANFKLLWSQILELRNVTVDYEGSLKILDAFSYTFVKGDWVGVVGRNGVGKSTVSGMSSLMFFFCSQCSGKLTIPGLGS